jgi:hypothetical protein
MLFILLSRDEFQIENFCRGISEREKVIVSLHPHNDRGENQSPTRRLLFY